MPNRQRERELIQSHLCHCGQLRYIICLQRFHVLVGTGQALKGSTHDLLPTFSFVKRPKGTEALHISSSAQSTHSSLMVGKENQANQKVPLLEGNPRVRDTKKNLAKPANTAENEEYMS